uniref:Cytochrome c oxidase assembly protein CtaG n=1 Tax=Arcella intermedia TaxID=1963864 RepID=A0A6B2LIS7_9EUKA
MLYLFASTIGMVGMSYAFVPLYRMFCQITGFGGTTQKIEKGTRYNVNTSKEITVNFSGQTASQLPWTFEPLQKSIDVYPGETVLAFYQATNNSDEPLIGIAMYGVYPPQAGKYFEKIECFCFDEQRIGPHETVDMPVLFTLNPDLLKSRSMKDVYNITLSYTFFLSSDQNIYWDEESNTYKTIEKEQSQ